MDKIEGKKIVLIGGAGFIGHNLALALKKAGAKVEIVDSLQVNNLLSFAYSNYGDANRDLYYRMINERLDLLRREEIAIEVQDARDYHALSRILDRIKPHIIIHLAAVAHANRSNKDPYSTFDHSLRTLENALDCARQGVERFVYFSSSMVYGNFNSASVTEDTICNPLGIYGALKYAGEKIVIAYNQVFGLPYTIVRPSALYGERCISRRVSQIFIENALKQLPVEINGNGTEQLDFTYINDLLQGIEKILESKNSKNQIFNITFGKARSVRDMAGILKKYFPKVKIKYLPKDKLMPERGTLCIDKAKKLLAYEPEFSLEKGLERYIMWYKTIYQ